jgi:hypothetical protein
MFSKIYKSRLIMLAIIFVLAAVIQVMTEEPPKPRSIPGINAPDKFPKGCVSCHKNYPDQKMDARLSTILTAWSEAVDPKILAKVQPVAPEGVTFKGKHPFKVTSETSMPEACNKCHGKMKNAPALSSLLHVIHLIGDKDNHFMTDFQGECTSCHKLDPQKGIWSIINGKESE